MSNQPKILFICTGNYYRSRFAEHFFNFRASSVASSWRAFSRGLRADNPQNPGAISIHTAEALAEMGIKIRKDERSPLQLYEEDLLMAQHIIAVKESEHLPMMQRLFPRWVSRTEFWEVHDLDVSKPADTIKALTHEVTRLLADLKNPIQ